MWTIRGKAGTHKGGKMKSIIFKIMCGNFIILFNENHFFKFVYPNTRHLS